MTPNPKTTKCRDCGDPVQIAEIGRNRSVVLNVQGDVRYVIVGRRAEKLPTFIAHSETCRQLRMDGVHEGK